jgi:ribosomal-protein-alanine N-acetyltransferase
MAAGDIPQIMEIERDSFPSMWPQTAYRRELTNNVARYRVIAEVADELPAQQPPSGVLGALRRIVGTGAPASEERILGFIGVWLMVGEAHIVTVAVREDCRRLGLGERLLIAGLEIAIENSQEAVTLEVRASNDIAQRLYEKYGFIRAGLRRRYYTDNNEDAVIMTTPDLVSAPQRARFEALRARHQHEHPDLWA